MILFRDTNLLYYFSSFIGCIDVSASHDNSSSSIWQIPSSLESDPGIATRDDDSFPVQSCLAGTHAAGKVLTQEVDAFRRKKNVAWEYGNF